MRKYETMKILEFSNWSFYSVENLVKYLRKLGEDVDWIRFKTEDEVPKEDDYDIVHTHYAIQMPVIKTFFKRFGKKTVLHLRGSDVRKLSLLYKPILFFEKMRSDLVFFSTPDLAQYTNGVWIPNFADFETFKPEGNPVYDDRIAVFASNQWTKNRELVKKIVLSLNEFKFDFVENIPHSAIMDTLRKYPLVIGQLSGSYGMSEIEAMSCGIPTVFYTSPRITSMIGSEIPSLENLDLDYIKDFIQTHIGDMSFGKKQRKFVEKYHNPIEITKIVIKIFKNLLEGDIPICDSD